MREITIDGTTVGDSSPVYAIVDIGHNHGGDLIKALQMVVSAQEAGASAVKFQTRHPKEVYAMQDKPGGYLFPGNHPQWLHPVLGEHRELLEFSQEEWERLFRYCRELGITAFSTPFDFSSADQLNELGVPAFKIASGDATNIPLIKYVAAFGKPMIVSTGGLDFEGVDRIYATLMAAAPGNFALLQCSCIYPAPDDVMHLRVITAFRERYSCPIGLSTHNKSWLPTVGAVALGARIFEHHYTNNQSWKGTDNHFSLTPETLRELVDASAQMAAAMGNRIKAQDPQETSYTIERQKKLIWAKNAYEGEILTREHFAILCPGDGVQPYHIDEFIGAVAIRDTEKDADVQWEDRLFLAKEPIHA